METPRPGEETPEEPPQPQAPQPQPPQPQPTDGGIPPSVGENESEVPGDGSMGDEGVYGE
jgi:hypothetical protein